MAKKAKTKGDDAPKITAALFARMRPMKDVDPRMVEAIKAVRGRPRAEQRSGNAWLCARFRHRQSQQGEKS